jgi:hypothetical protein
VTALAIIVASTTPAALIVFERGFRGVFERLRRRAMLQAIVKAYITGIRKGADFILTGIRRDLCGNHSKSSAWVTDSSIEAGFIDCISFANFT